MTARGYASDLVHFILALAAGIGWRLELELRWGWQSLAWINGFHWAVPVSIMLCIGWAVWVGRVRERVVFAAVLVGFAFAVFTAISFAFPLYFAAGPTAVITDVIFGKSGRLVRFLVPLLWASVPLMFCWICRFFGAPITIAQSLASALLFVLSWPVAVFVRTFFEQQGSPDTIHALKSGFVIPLLILSLAFPLLRISPTLAFHSPSSKDSVR
jgi:hypothetical protein